MRHSWHLQVHHFKDEKTVNKFGPIVHAYTMQRAVEDKTVTPLLYEERIPDLDVNERAIDTWFERITEGLNDQQKADLKRKFAKKVRFILRMIVFA
jgi:type I restriction enzyme R subunit